MHLFAYVYFVWREYDYYRLFHAHHSRLHTFILTQFSSPNIYSLAASCYALAEFGELVISRNLHNWPLFWILYVLIPALAALVIQNLFAQQRNYEQFGGGRAGMIALAFFAIQTLPANTKLLLFNQVPVPLLGILLLNIVWALMECAQQSNKFWTRLAEIGLIQIMTFAYYKYYLVL